MPRMSFVPVLLNSNKLEYTHNEIMHGELSNSTLPTLWRVLESWHCFHVHMAVLAQYY